MSPRVMIGLKSFLKEFSDLTQGELSHDALYARQRELVRCGLLPVREGRGPGSGVPLSADTLATFLIGLLATDSLIDLGERTAQLCDARPLDFPKGELARRSRATFRGDVAKALMGSEIAGFGTDAIPVEWVGATARAEPNPYSGIQVTRHWRGVILGYRRIEMPDGTVRHAVHGAEYFCRKAKGESASVLARAVSIEQSPFWVLCMRFRHFMEVK
jgi:hypothetical protein